MQINLLKIHLNWKNILLSRIYGFCLLLFLLIFPVSWFANTDNFKKLLKEQQLYDYIASLLAQNWDQEIDNSDNGLWEQIVLEEKENLLSPQFLESVFVNIADTFAKSIDTKQSISDIEIDISSLKNQYLEILKTRQITHVIAYLDSDIPNTIDLSTLFGVSKESIENVSTNFILYSQFLRFSLWILASLIGTTFLIWILLIPFKKVFDKIFKIHIVVGSLLVFLWLATKIILYFPNLLPWVNDNSGLTWAKLFILFSLEFLSQVSFFWLCIGLMLLTISAVKILFFKFGK